MIVKKKASTNTSKLYLTTSQWVCMLFQRDQGKIKIHKLWLSSVEAPDSTEMVWTKHTDSLVCSAPVFSCSADDSFSHYSLSVHGCRLSLFYWPDVSAARPVKFLWKLEQVLLREVVPDWLKQDGLKDTELMQTRFVKSLRLNHNILLPHSFSL